MEKRSRHWRAGFPRFAILAGILCALVWPLFVSELSAWARSRDEISSDFDLAANQLDTALQGGRLFANAEDRQSGAPEMLATIDRILSISQEEQQAGILPQMGVNGIFARMHILKLALDDPTAKLIQKKAIANGGTDAATAAVTAAAAEYLHAAQNEAAQTLAMDHLAKAFKSIKPDAPIMGLPDIFLSNPPAGQAVASKVVGFINASCNTTWKGNSTASMWQGYAECMPALAARLSLIDKPMTIEGTLVDGSKFSTAKWKGKVIWVDFWATWCPDCVADRTELANRLAANRSKGLEVVSISADNDGGSLKSFLAKNKFINWPQMFDFAHPGLKPLEPTYGVCNIPIPLIIDRKGILRYANIALNAHVRDVKHQEDPDVLIARLLAEAP
jgi:thiol-disulfide isomerase/thioredoxin